MPTLSLSSFFMSMTILLNSILSQANFQLPYNGASLPGNLNNNPYYLNKLLGNLGSQPQTVGACAQIPGIGLPILSLKKFLINIDQNLDSANSNSFSKIIYFNETSVPQGLLVSLVLKFYTFSAKFYVGVQGLLKTKGLPRFQLMLYVYDSNILNVQNTIGATFLDDNNFITCGEVKTIYTNYLRSLQVNTARLFNIPTGHDNYSYNYTSSA